MKYKIAIIFTALLCTVATVTIWTRGETSATHFQDFADISVSAVHGDTDINTFRPQIIVRETPTISHKIEAGATATNIYLMDVWDLGLELYGISYTDTNRALRLITYEGYGYSPLSYYVACCCWVRATEGYWGYGNLYSAFGEADTSYNLLMDSLGIADYAYDYLWECYMNPTYVRYCNGMAQPTNYIYYENGIYVWN